ncbi:MAG: hypothetical protein IT423_07595, partial [Pirellulaceae bacterium]|nr:hypothetical protein [Pirellulaceae bacterium]
MSVTRNVRPCAIALAGLSLAFTFASAASAADLGKLKPPMIVDTGLTAEQLAVVKEVRIENVVPSQNGAPSLVLRGSDARAQLLIT